MKNNGFRTDKTIWKIKKKLEDKVPNVKTYYKVPVIKQINGTDQRIQKQTHTYTSADFQLKCQVNSIRKGF